MNTGRLLATLQPLEMKLHSADTRKSPDTLACLLHADFEEIGRSGRHYSRDEVLAEFRSATTFPQVVSTSYSARWVADDLALLTYRSAHVDADDRLHRHSLRSSLWHRTADGWQLVFHQGTPAPVTDWPPT